VLFLNTNQYNNVLCYVNYDIQKICSQYNVLPYKSTLLKWLVHNFLFVFFSLLYCCFCLDGHVLRCILA